jgi:preprotein translocase subunit Sss1
MENQPAMPNNLETFRILYIIKGVLNLIGAIGFLVYGLMGNIFLSVPEVQDEMDDVPEVIGSIFVAIGFIGFVVALVIAILTFMAAKYLKERRNLTFILVVAVINFFSGILGIMLGVFTILELNKPHVRVLFRQNEH